MVRVAKIVTVGLAGIGVVEIAFRGADAALYAWYLLFALWMVALFARFALAVVDAVLVKHGLELPQAQRRHVSSHGLRCLCTALYRARSAWR